ncbi:hypothetical protein SAMN05428977_100916 [Nitrosomonas sp. Nm166]|nr:hypothetical protein SAMN05428977_100916 [Nitrosomonas sp. Nm166]
MNFIYEAQVKPAREMQRLHITFPLILETLMVLKQH